MIVGAFFVIFIISTENKLRCFPSEFQAELFRDSLNVDRLAIVPGKKRRPTLQANTGVTGILRSAATGINIKVSGVKSLAVSSDGLQGPCAGPRLRLAPQYLASALPKTSPGQSCFSRIPPPVISPARA